MMPGHAPRRAPSTSSAPAATIPAATTSRPSPRSSSPPAACRWPSTATAPRPRAPARPTCSRPSACRLGLDAGGLGRCLAEAGLCFMFAQTHHAAMRHVAPVRAELPDAHHLQPARAPRESGRRRAPALRRVAQEAWAEPLTRVLAELGSRRVWTVHGSRRPRRDHRHGPDARSSPWRTGGSRRFTIDPQRGRPRRCAARGPARRRSRSTTPGALDAVLDGRAQRLPRHRGSQCRRRPRRRRGRRNAGGRASRGRRMPSIPGAARATLARLVRVSNDHSNGQEGR